MARETGFGVGTVLPQTVLAWCELHGIRSLAARALLWRTVVCLDAIFLRWRQKQDEEEKKKNKSKRPKPRPTA